MKYEYVPLESSLRNSSALFLEPQDSQREFSTKQTSSFWLIMNIVASQIGIGVLTIPFLFYQNGVFVTVVIFILAYAINIIPVKMMDQIASDHNIRSQKMEMVYQKVLGKKGKAVCVIFIIACQTSYYISRIYICSKLIRTIHETIGLWL